MVGHQHVGIAFAVEDAREDLVAIDVAALVWFVIVIPC
jgi:hypothetical protein